jgi:hypothetical protein
MRTVVKKAESALRTSKRTVTHRATIYVNLKDGPTVSRVSARTEGGSIGETYHSAPVFLLIISKKSSRNLPSARKARIVVIPVRVDSIVDKIGDIVSA